MAFRMFWPLAASDKRFECFGALSKFVLGSVESASHRALRDGCAGPEAHEAAQRQAAPEVHEVQDLHARSETVSASGCGGLFYGGFQTCLTSV